MAKKKEIKFKRAVKSEKFGRMQVKSRVKRSLNLDEQEYEQKTRREETTIFRDDDGKIRSKGTSHRTKRTLNYGEGYYKKGKFKAVSDPKVHDEGEEAAIHGVSKERIRRLRKKSFEEKLEASGRKKKRKSSLKKKQEEKIKREPRG